MPTELDLDHGEMRVHVKTNTGETFKLLVRSSDTILVLKARICEATKDRIPPSKQKKVVIKLKQRGDDETLVSCDVKAEDVLHLVLCKPSERLRDAAAMQYDCDALDALIAEEDRTIVRLEQGLRETETSLQQAEESGRMAGEQILAM